MTHEDITLAVRMIARGMVNHETVQALVAELTRVIAQGQKPALEAAAETPKADIMPLSRAKKR